MRKEFETMWVLRKDEKNHQLIKTHRFNPNLHKRLFWKNFFMEVGNFFDSDLLYQKKRWKVRDSPDSEWMKLGDTADTRRQRADGIEREKRNFWTTIIVAIVSIIVAINLSLIPYVTEDEYVGFFYPDKNNLFIDVMSDQTFETVSDCRIWAETTALQNIADVYRYQNGWDYECGKNCKITGSKPYVCEETVR